MVLTQPRLWGVAVVSVGLLAPATRPRASAQADTALIVGQVVDGDSAKGIGDAIVTLGGGPGAAPASPLAPPPPGRRLLTTANGQFVYRQLAPGRYTLSATKPGYGIGVVGRLVPRGPGGGLEIRPGEKLTDVRILMWRHASITGRVLDEAGEPVVGAEVRAQRAQLVAGRPGFASTSGAMTDDRGVYRIASLDPGRYVVSVPSTSTTLPAVMLDEYMRGSGVSESRSEMQQALFQAAPTMSSLTSASNLQVGAHILQIQGRMPLAPPPSGNTAIAVYPRVFFTGANRAADATPVVLRSGDARAGVDLRLRAVPSARVTGRTESADGPLGVVAMFLLHAGPGGEPLGSVGTEAVATTVAEASGAFTFVGVPSGSYALVAVKLPAVTERVTQATVIQAPGGTVSRGIVEPVAVSSKPVYWAVQPVAVAEKDTNDLRVVMKPGLRVSGRVVFEGGQPAGMRAPTVFLESTEDWLRTYAAGEFERQASPDGTFAIPGVPAGRYQLTVPLPSGVFVKNVLVNGRNVSDLPFVLDQDLRDVVITISSRGARVSGIVRDANGRPDATAGVIIFPADSRAWVDLSSYPRRLKDVRTSRDGSYAVADLPAGEYLIAAAPQAAFDWSVSNFFERLGRVATRVTLGDGEQRTLDLRLQVVAAGLQPGGSPGGLKPAGYGRR